jgi:hypothetical protein
MKTGVALVVAMIAAALEQSSIAMADEVAPPAVYVPPIPVELLPPDSTLAQRAIAVARMALQTPALQTQHLKGTAIKAPSSVQVLFSDPSACPKPCPDFGEPTCGVVLMVQLDETAAEVVSSSVVREVRCPTS